MSISKSKQRDVCTTKQMRKGDAESLCFESELGERLLSKFGKVSVVSVSVSISAGGSGFGGRGGRRFGNGSLSELSLDPSDSRFELSLLQWNTQIVVVFASSTLTARVLYLDQGVRSAPGTLASKLPTPRELLASPPSSFGDGFTGLLGDVHVGHRELVTFREITKGDQGEFRCASLVE